MKAKDYIQKFIRTLGLRNDVGWKTYPLQYKAGDFELLKIQSSKITAKDKVILITSWIHGEEIAGPLSLLKYINKIIDLIHGYGYKLIIYPLNNPSGFEYVTRLDIDNDSWPCGNNDFIRYQMPDGTFQDECKEGQTFAKRYRSSDPVLQQRLPVETALLHKLLREDPLHQVVGHLDFHQDYITPISWPYAYFYTFSDSYQPIIATIKKHIPLLTNTVISAGETWWVMSNDNACIIRHDGTINDLLFRLGLEDTITVETTGQTPLPLAQKINRFWIKWLVLFLNHKTSCWSKKPSSSRQEAKKRK